MKLNADIEQEVLTAYRQEKEPEEIAKEVSARYKMELSEAKKIVKDIIKSKYNAVKVNLKNADTFAIGDRVKVKGEGMHGGMEGIVKKQVDQSHVLVEISTGGGNTGVKVIPTNILIKNSDIDAELADLKQDLADAKQTLAEAQRENDTQAAMQARQDISKIQEQIDGLSKKNATEFIPAEARRNAGKDLYGSKLNAMDAKGKDIKVGDDVFIVGGKDNELFEVKAITSAGTVMLDNGDKIYGGKLEIAENAKYGSRKNDAASDKLEPRTIYTASEIRAYFSQDEIDKLVASGRVEKVGMNGYRLKQ